MQVYVKARKETIPLWLGCVRAVWIYGVLHLSSRTSLERSVRRSEYIINVGGENPIRTFSKSAIGLQDFCLDMLSVLTSAPGLS